MKSDRANAAGYSKASTGVGPSGRSWGGPSDSMAKGRAADRGSVKGYAGKAPSSVPADMPSKMPTHKGFAKAVGVGRFARPGIGARPQGKDLKDLGKRMEEDQRYNDEMTQMFNRGVEDTRRHVMAPSLRSRGPKP